MALRALLKRVVVLVAVFAVAAVPMLFGMQQLDSCNARTNRFSFHQDAPSTPSTSKTPPKTSKTPPKQRVVYIGNTGLHTCYVEDDAKPSDGLEQLWYNIVDRTECCYDRKGSVMWGIVIITADAVIAATLAVIACCQCSSPGHRRASSNKGQHGSVVHEAHVEQTSNGLMLAIGRRDDSVESEVILVVQP